MSRDKLDDILRSHFRDHLAGQRGRALQAFEQRVTRPMELRLNAPARVSRLRQWSVRACAMAACVGVGFMLPRLLTSGPISPLDAGLADGAGTGTNPGTPMGTMGNAITPNYANFERTTLWNNIDAGPVMLDPQTPGRKVHRQRVDQYRWTDPDTKAQIEYYAPAEQQEFMLEVNRQ